MQCTLPLTVSVDAVPRLHHHRHEAEAKSLSSSSTFKATTLSPLQAICDLTAAVIAASVLSIPVTIFDTSIIEGIAGGGRAPSLSQRLWRKVRLMRHGVLRGYPHMVAVYTSTYAVANWTQSYYDVTTGQSPGVMKALTTTAINAPACMWKDAHYARMFGSGAAPARPFPVLSLFLFLVRDLLSMYFSFSLPTVVAQAIPSISPNVATVLCPVTSQLVISVIHIYAFDVYNRPSAPAASRALVIRQRYQETVGVRMCRVLVAYGMGSLLNTHVRADLHTRAFL